MNVKIYLREAKEKIDRELDKLIPEVSKKDQLIKAMRYSVFPGGKRFRPILTLEAAKLFGIDRREVIIIACAIEFVHTFSLIHDDLPCMDNDDYRRGKLTCHRVFGEDIALLAGDALLNQAYTCLMAGYKRGDFSDKILAELVAEFSKTLGEKGLIGGQVNDLIFKGKTISLKKIEEIYLQKTAGLFTLAARSAAIIAFAKKEEVMALSNFAKNFGLAFQIIDDCLDCNYVRQAKESLGIFGRKAEGLKKIADFIVERKF